MCVILLLNIHLNISVYGQDASTDKTFLHSNTCTPITFLLQRDEILIMIGPLVSEIFMFESVGALTPVESHPIRSPRELLFLHPKEFTYTLKDFKNAKK